MGVRDKIAKAVMDAVGGIKAYHSSPHDFDRFDLSKIGSGEGAQVYGHGIYAAENPKVSGQGGEYWNQFMNHPALPEAQQHAGGRLRAEGFDKEKAIAATQRDVNDWLQMTQSGLRNGRPASPMDLEHAQRMLMMRQGELEALVSGKAGPRTYELNIKADPAQMLDWDKTLSQQSPFVQDVMSRQISKHWPKLAQPELDRSGDWLYQAAAGPQKNRNVGYPASTDALGEAGIPGIKYLDQQSRQLAAKMAHAESRANLPANEGVGGDIWRSELAQMQKTPLTSNYVVFDPSIIDITRKYALPGALGAGAMGGIAAQDQYEVAP